MLELMRVDVERDARPCVAELTGRANRIDPRADQVTRERVPEIVEAELRHTVAVEARRLCSSVETTLRNVVPVERRTCGGGEDIGVRAWQPARSLGGAEVITEMRLELTGECDVSPTGLRLEVDAARRARLRATTQLGSHADHALAEVDVTPGESEDLLDPHPAEYREREQRPIPRRAALESSRTSSAVRVRGSLWARPRGSSSRCSRSIGFSARYPRRAARSNTRRNGVTIPRIVHGASPDVRREPMSAASWSAVIFWIWPLAEYRNHVKIECAPVSLESALRPLTRRDEALRMIQELHGDLGKRDLRRRRDLATPLLREERVSLRLRLCSRPRAERLHPPDAVRVRVPDLVAPSAVLVGARRGCRRYGDVAYYARSASGAQPPGAAPPAVTAARGLCCQGASW